MGKLGHLQAARAYCYNTHNMVEKQIQSKQKIVIVGGGFGGVHAAQLLAKESFAEVTLISDREDFYYYPRLYHTATGGSEKSSVIPLKKLFAGTQVQLVTGRVTIISPEAHSITLEDKSTIVYDKIIFGLGVITNYFGIPGLAEYSYGIKSLNEVERFKRHLHAQMIAAHEPDLNYIIVGGGPTGIELAGDLGTYLKDMMAKHHIKHRAVHIDLVEAMPHLMPRLPKEVGRSIERRLRKLGVKLFLNSKVEGASPDELTVNGKPIRSHTIVWTAGMANNPFFAEPVFSFSPRKKIIVDEFLRAEGHKDIFVIGDNAETPFSGMAQTALHDAEFVAHNLRFEHEGRPKLAYRNKDPFYITPVGNKWASFVYKSFHFYGKLGWIMRDAADLRAFLYIESPAKATEQWATEFEREDLCPICSAN